MASVSLIFVGITLSTICMTQVLAQANWRPRHAQANWRPRHGPAVPKQSLRNAGTVVSHQARQSSRHRVVSPQHQQGIYSSTADAFFDLTSVNMQDKHLLDLLWTPWSTWSLCSRSCGGGAAMRKRRCQRSPPAMCEGSKIDYMLCNTQDCPKGSPSFRNFQCSQHSDKLVPFKGYEWIPYPTDDGAFTCQIYCVAKDQRFIHPFGIAVDGTRCGRKNKDMCIGGECAKVGCDMVIGSTTTEDACGVCGGNNATCYHYEGTYNKLPDNAEDFNYNEVTKIPAGAAHVYVRDNSSNYLALFEADEYFDRYVINGNKILSWPGEFVAAGTTVMYARTGDTETFEIVGPTTKDLYIMILYLSQEPRIKYEYWIPNSLRPDYDAFAELRRIYSYQDYNPFDYDPGLEPEIADPTVEPTTITINSNTTIATTSTTTTTTATTQTTTTTTASTTLYLPTTTRSKPKSQKGGRQPKPRTSIPMPVALVNQSRCGRCKKPRNRKTFYCESDFAIHARIISNHRLRHGLEYRYDVEILTTYKSDVTLMTREYVWIPSACCPRLRPLRTYLLMGRKVKVDVTDEKRGKRKGDEAAVHRFETRLTITRSNYWAKWKKSYEKSMAKVSNKLNCEKYMLRKKRKGKKHGVPKSQKRQNGNAPST